jgi:hypothetical protein
VRRSDRRRQGPELGLFLCACFAIALPKGL